MRDFVGKELEIGDSVVYKSSGRYCDLHRAVVVGFTKHMVRIESKTYGEANVYSDRLVKYSF